MPESPKSTKQASGRRASTKKAASTAKETFPGSGRDNVSPNGEEQGQDSAAGDRGGAVNELWRARELESAVAGRSGEADLSPPEESRGSARLEHRAEVDGEERENYHQNYKKQRHLEREAEIKRENAFASSLRGKLWRVPLTRWLFNRQTRRLEALIVFGLVTAVLGVALSILHSGRQLQVVQTATAAGLATQAGPSEGLGEALMRGREETERVIREFFQAQSEEEVVALIRAPEVLKSVMTRWYESHPLRQETIDEFKSIRIRELEGSRFFLHFVRFVGDPEVRPIPVEETEEGYRVDWETAVGYQAMDWTDYRAQRPTEPTYMRVYVQPSDYYNFGFRNDKPVSEWSAYRLSHPDEDRPLYGYVKSFSPQEEQLNRVLKGRDGEYFILRLQFPENAPSDHQVHIMEILQANWVRPYEAGDVHFDEAQSSKTED